MLRYKTEIRPGLVALYDIRSGNGAGQFLQLRSPHGALRRSKLLCNGLVLDSVKPIRKINCNNNSRFYPPPGQPGWYWSLPSETDALIYATKETKRVNSYNPGVRTGRCQR